MGKKKNFIEERKNPRVSYSRKPNQRKCESNSLKSGKLRHRSTSRSYSTELRQGATSESYLTKLRHDEATRVRSVGAVVTPRECSLLAQWWRHGQETRG